MNRGQESPMDFQWENPSARIDPNSPFRLNTARVVAGQETPTKKAGSQDPFVASPAKPSTPFRTSTPFQTAMSKNLFSTFATSATSKPAEPMFRTPSFTQPRFNNDLRSALPDLSSPLGLGIDTDSEAPTPDQLAYEARRHGFQTNPTPIRAPGRGEIPRGRNTEKRVSKAKRLHSRGRKSRDYDRHAYVTEEEEDEVETGDETDYSRPRRRIAKRVKETYQPGWASLHRDVPQILLEYAGVFLRISLGLLLVYCIYNITMTVRRDIHYKVAAAADEMRREIDRCAYEHTRNRCAPDTIVPAIQERCDNWERCMNQDPSKVSWTTVGAETAAEVANSFFNNISMKTMVFTALVVIGCLFTVSGVGSKVPPPVHHTYTHPPSIQPPLSWMQTPHAIQTPHASPRMLRQNWQTPMLMPETPTRSVRKKPAQETESVKSIEWE